MPKEVKSLPRLWSAAKAAEPQGSLANRKLRHHGSIACCPDSINDYSMRLSVRNLLQNDFPPGARLFMVHLG